MSRVDPDAPKSPEKKRGVLSPQKERTKATSSLSKGNSNKDFNLSLISIGSPPGSNPGSARKTSKPVEPVTHFINSKLSDEIANAKVTLRVELADKVFEQNLEASSAAIKSLCSKLIKPMKKTQQKTDGKIHLKDHLVFGVSLKKFMQIQQLKYPNVRIPLFLKQGINYIMRKGLGIEGIFRTDSSKAELRLLIDSLNSGEDVSFDDFKDVVLVGDLVKQYIQDLPEPLIMSNYYTTFLAIEDLGNRPLKLETFKKIITCLPSCHQDLIQELLYLFYQISLNSSVNQMGAENLAIIFSPIFAWRKGNEGDNVQNLVKELNKAAKVLQLAIEEYHSLFPAKPIEQDEGMQPTEFTKKLVGHLSAIQAATTTDDFSEVWSGDHLGVIRIWDAESCLFKRCLQPRRGMIFAILSTPGYLWVASSTCLQVYDVKTDEMIHEILGAKFSLELVSQTIWAGGVGSISIYDVETGEELGSVIVPGRKNLISISGQDEKLWAASHQNLYVFNVHTYELLKEIRDAHTKKINSILQVGGLTWTGGEDCIIKLWNMETFECIHQIEAHSGPVLGLSVFGSHVWSCSMDCTIRIWESSTLERLQELRGFHTDGIYAVAPVWSPTRGKCFGWSTSLDASICVWETAYKTVFVKKRT